MSQQNPFAWSGRTQAGLGLFVASLLGLAIATPNIVSISFAVGAGACAALFGVTGSRFWLFVLTVLMLGTTAASLFAALLFGGYILLPVALAQIVAVSLLEGREQGWVAEAGAGESTGSGWSRQRA